MNGKFAIHVKDYKQYLLLILYLNNTGFSTPTYPIFRYSYREDYPYFEIKYGEYSKYLISDATAAQLPVVEFEDFAPVKEFFSIEPINKESETVEKQTKDAKELDKLDEKQEDEEQTLLDSIDFSDIYGVEQSVHGHNYRFIYTGTDLRGFINLPVIIKGHDFYEDIRFPFGGSNCSSTRITALESLDDVKDFLLADYKTDLADPQLIDIAEGICTIQTGYNSITSQFIELLHIPQSELTKDNALLAESEKMIQELKSSDTDYDIDFDNPFYGTSRNMRFSDLTALYEAYIAYKDAMQNEPELD